MRVAVIIPTLEERPRLDGLVPPLLRVADQVWVVDGGSADGTAERARELGARVVVTDASRGRQLDRGARAADADVLLFLHADTALGVGALDAVRRAIRNGAVGGGFHLRFDEDRPWLRLGARLIDRRTDWTGLPLGDQAQFVRRDVYQELGGYRHWPILEDLDFARRLKRGGPIRILDPPVVTSARRFVRLGPVRTVATNWSIWALFLLGTSPERLARLYGRVR